MNTKTEMIRTLKATQTETLKQRAMLEHYVAALDYPEHPSELSNQLWDAKITADNHIQALQHAIDALTKDGA